MIQIFEQTANSNFVNMQAARYETVFDLFKNIVDFLPTLSKNKNLHYTVAKSTPDNTRGFIQMNCYYWDIDDLPEYFDIEKYSFIFANTMNIPKGNFSVVKSGHGLHFIIHLNEESRIADKDVLNNLKKYYSSSCKSLQESLIHADLVGTVDVMFNSAKTLRLPGTINSKKGLPEVFCELYTLGKEINFDIRNACFIFDVSDLDRSTSKKITPKKIPTPNLHSVNSQIYLEPIKISTETTTPGDLYDFDDYKKKGYLPPDTLAILNRCGFLVWCKENQAQVKEPQWYAMLSIVGRLHNGHKLAHDFSNQHPKYTHQETTKKYDQAMTKSGPRSCCAIHDIWVGCEDCPQFNKIFTPIQIRDYSSISSEKQGFYLVKQNAKTGDIKRIPDYEGLYNKFTQEYHHLTHAETEDIFIYDQNKYIPKPPSFVKSYAQQMFVPKPLMKQVDEFNKFLRREKIVPKDFWYDSTKKLINLQNGILNLETMRLIPHNPFYGFTSCFDYTYDPTATCPAFESWLDKICEHDEELINSIVDFLAYTLAGSEFSNDMILVLYGDGKNGKSTFLRLVRKLFDGLWAEVYPKDFIETSPFALKNLEHKLIALCDEFPSFSNKIAWESIKNLSSGGMVRIGEKFKPEYTIRNCAKFVFTCNSLPGGTDPTSGFFRRFLFIPFDYVITEEEKVLNFENKLFGELSGILNKILERLPKLKERGFVLKPSKKSDEILEDYSLQRDHLKFFITERIKLFDGNPKKINTDSIVKYLPSGKTFCAADDLFKFFRVWCEEVGIKSYTNLAQFSNLLNLRLEKLGIKRVQIQIKEKRRRGFENLMIID